ncbi:hypothetical protein [Alistipes sp.]|uniref:hypothetical protein n=1 Tax=Alistipes sp. TaxID=1872444 RepID=UPI0025C207D4|nr:hypothetical protein [Alistipes sp.]
MKKVLFSRIIMTMALSLFAAGCIIDDPEPGPNLSGGGDDTTEPSDPETFITVDGDFSDWDQIPSDELVETTVPDDAFYSAGRKLKVYAGATYINIYLEYSEQESPVQIMHLYIDSDMAFDDEGNPTTGMGNPAWTNDGSDILLEGMLKDDSGNPTVYDPTIFTWSGENLSGGWDWTEAVAAGSGICSNCEPVALDNGNMAIEMTIVRSAIPNLGKTFRLGVGLQYDWNDIAYLPAGSAVEENGEVKHGAVENLLIGGEKESYPEVFITVDGDFSDWDQIPEQELTIGTVPDDAFYKAGKLAKVYAGDTYINFYVEYEDSEEQPVQIMHFYIDADAAFDADGNPTTGMGNPAWTNDGSDVLFEGMVVDDSGVAAAYDPTIFSWTGENISGGWDWTEILAAGSGVCSSSVPVELENGHKAVEIVVVRSSIPNLGSRFRVGIGLQYDWNDIAYIPAGSAVEENGEVKHGAVENMLVGR